MRISDWSSDVCSSDLQARNLASLPSSVVNQLRANLATTERLIAQARGLAYDVTNLDREFARLYPEQYAATVSGDQMYRAAQARWRNTPTGLQTTKIGNASSRDRVCQNV